MSTTIAASSTIQVLGAPGDRFDEILTPEALDFVARLDAAFANRRFKLFAERRRLSGRLASGFPLDFSRATSGIRNDPHWQVAPPAPGLTDRRVEITGPPDRRTAAAALTSGAQVWMADFEDSTSPTWDNIVGGQLTLLDAVERRIDLTGPEGEQNRAGGELPTVMVRPRGWHLTEKHLVIDGRPLSASLVDFGLYVFHCAQRQIDADRGPYFYLPKLEHREEARLWNDVFVLAQELLGIPRGTIRATVLVETVTAALEMEEILYELREHGAGLNAGRWDYLFSLIKNFAHRPDFTLPDRDRVTMTAQFLRSYTELLVRTCHKRGAHAIGGMAAHLPVQDAGARESALARVRLDKEREAEDGFDGTWVAHPALVPLCRDIFDAVLAGRPHQLDRTREDVHVTADDLLAVRRTAGPPTLDGVRSNISLALRYFDAWLRGQGAVPLDGHMEDAAAAEIARSQVWQWIRHGAVERDTVLAILDEEIAALGREYPWARVDDVREIFERTALARTLPEFFTTDAYARHLVRRPEVQS
ncbi:malate synthase A [Streptomyces sp. NBC_01167]|uniref:malate synthase A n=1 Tax=Streptomyces sp. NBC_01167 TaxID=2903756 RepID=UPI00386C055B|nr:malate synthase A [Streptomyces sp. NBC_01167]